ncbi:MAG: hypothetical protein CVV41_20235 [Candidatus Riflebacteria bacterium HGW-Riflebacteria-1]|jgi:hypothetical protein|nr:MAG: hypothetical protein CVV41_20235 [Candidatus Riflebacteria bacterium HGW-Riflebacteria-1]
MKGLKKLSVMLLLVGSIFMTGCDATQIVEMIGKIAQGVQQAMPAIQSVVDTFKGIFGNDNNAAANNNQQAAATNNTASATAETNKPAEANVITIDPNKEEVASPTAAAPETGATGNTIAVATQTATVATPTAAVAAAAVEISAAAQKQMDAVVAYALANNRGASSGQCFNAVWEYLTRSGYGNLKQWGDLPAMQSGEARNFSGYLNASQRNLDEAGLKRLDTTLNPPITSPHDPRIPKGAVIVVAAGSTGTAHPTAGDITIKAGEGRFVNDGPNMDYGTAATWQGKLLGVYIPK